MTIKSPGSKQITQNYCQGVTIEIEGLDKTSDDSLIPENKKSIRYLIDKCLDENGQGLKNVHDLKYTFMSRAEEL